MNDHDRILSDFFADRRNAAGDYWCKQMAWEAHQSIVAEQSRALAESRAKVEELEAWKSHALDRLAALEDQLVEAIENSRP